MVKLKFWRCPKCGIGSRLLHRYLADVLPGEPGNGECAKGTQMLLIPRED